MVVARSRLKAGGAHETQDTMGLVPPVRSKEAMTKEDIEHLAFSIAHGTFRHDEAGGCSCDLCSAIRTRISELDKEEAAAFYDEHYPPPGGFL
jgi:hypothetical protein